MDCYFLKFKITEFTYNSNSENKNKDNNIDINQNVNETEDTKDNNTNYEIEFDLTKSYEKYELKIINDNKGKITPLSYYFTLPTSICINKDNNNNDILKINNYIEKDFLEISLYSSNGTKEDDKKLIDINDNILIDNTCLTQPKFAEIYLGNFHFKFLYKLSFFEDLCIREKDMYLMIDKNDNNNNNENNDDNDIEDNYNNIEGKDNENDEVEEEEDLVTKYHNLLGNKPVTDDIVYEDDLFNEIELIDFEEDKEKKSPEKNIDAVNDENKLLLNQKSKNDGNDNHNN